jgi:hypothetical protein
MKTEMQKGDRIEQNDRWNIGHINRTFRMNIYGGYVEPLAK